MIIKKNILKTDPTNKSESDNEAIEKKIILDSKNTINDSELFVKPKSLYAFNDSDSLQSLSYGTSISTKLYALDKLLERDKIREKDGFPRKIKLGKLVKPSRDGDGKTIIIPTAAEEKFYHMNRPQDTQEPSTGGTGDGEEGDVIGEQPIRGEEGEGTGAGQGSAAEHSMGADAYEIGKILTEQFELPNIKEKGKKTALAKYTYDLTDKNRGHGQLLDKKATLKRIVKTNVALGVLSPEKKIDTSNFVLNPTDRTYRILSREKDYESQAIVFFLRDYSGSMNGKPTEVVVTQHIYIYSWLIYQYKKQVTSRFILHDTEASEVPDFYTYYNKQVAGGTEVSSAYELVNKIVEEENLIRDYNIYIFHGTDGDDWNDDGSKATVQLEKMLNYANRIGITIAENQYSASQNTVVEKYIKKSGFLEKHSDILHLDSFKAEESNEERIIESIKQLIE